MFKASNSQEDADLVLLKANMVDSNLDSLLDPEDKWDNVDPKDTWHLDYTTNRVLMVPKWVDPDTSDVAFNLTDLVETKWDLVNRTDAQWDPVMPDPVVPPCKDKTDLWTPVQT